MPPGAPTPEGIEGAMKRYMGEYWCTLQWCASRGWVIAHEDWTSCVLLWMFAILFFCWLPESLLKIADFHPKLVWCHNNEASFLEIICSRYHLPLQCLKFDHLAPNMHLWSLLPIFSCQNQTLSTHWGWDKMAVISQMAFSNAFYWMKMFEFSLIFHWSLLLAVQWTMYHQRWFR